MNNALDAHSSYDRPTYFQRAIDEAAEAELRAQHLIDVTGHEIDQRKTTTGELLAEVAVAEAILDDPVTGLHDLAAEAEGGKKELIRKAATY